MRTSAIILALGLAPFATANIAGIIDSIIHPRVVKAGQELKAKMDAANKTEIGNVTISRREERECDHGTLDGYHIHLPASCYKLAIGNNANTCDLHLFGARGGLNSSTFDDGCVPVGPPVPILKPEDPASTTDNTKLWALPMAPKAAVLSSASSRMRRPIPAPMFYNTSQPVFVGVNVAWEAPHDLFWGCEYFNRVYAPTWPDVKVVDGAMAACEGVRHQHRWVDGSDSWMQQDGVSQCIREEFYDDIVVDSP